MATSPVVVNKDAKTRYRILDPHVSELNGVRVTDEQRQNGVLLDERSARYYVEAFTIAPWDIEMSEAMNQMADLQFKPTTPAVAPLSAPAAPQGEKLGIDLVDEGKVSPRRSRVT